MRPRVRLLLRFCATALLCCHVAPAATAAEPAGGTTPQAGISRDQADAMLLELREIRKLQAIASVEHQETAPLKWRQQAEDGAVKEERDD